MSAGRPTCHRMRYLIARVTPNALTRQRRTARFLVVTQSTMRHHPDAQLYARRP